MPFPVLAPLLFVLGLCVGSFLNVVIARVPQGRSVVRPGSACPRCGKPIAWFDNIPLLSYAVLRARCRHCGEPISLRYPLVELVTGLLFVLAAWELGSGLNLVAGLTLIAGLIAITAIDLDCQLIPDVISLPGIVLGFILSAIAGRPGWLESLIGILVGGGLFFVIIVASRGGMGGGDMKLGAMLGVPAATIAERTGIAFQLTNIIRDVREDALLGRVYLPQEDLARFGRQAGELAPERLVANNGNGFQAAPWADILRFEADRAREFYRAADELIPLIDEDCQPALWTLVTIYRSLLDKIALRQYDVFQERVRLTVPEKVKILSKGFVRRLA